MGMLKEGVRRDRVRGGRQKYKPSLHVSSSSLVLHHQATKPLGIIKQASPSSNTSSSLQECNLLSSLLSIEPEKVYAMPDQSLVSNEHKLMVTLSDLTDRELVATIGWAKQVPGFADVPISDQINLLRGTWLDVVCLNVAFRSMPYNGDICYADDFRMSQDDSAVYSVPRGLDRATRRLVKKMTDLKVMREEFALLKALLLFNPDTNLESPQLVQQQRERVYDCLVEYEGQRGGSLEKRISQLLFILPLIVNNKFMSREFWTRVRQNNRVSLSKLVSEMLQYAFS